MTDQKSTQIFKIPVADGVPENIRKIIVQTITTISTEKFSPVDVFDLMTAVIFFVREKAEIPLEEVLEALCKYSMGFDQRLAELGGDVPVNCVVDARGKEVTITEPNPLSSYLN